MKNVLYFLLFPQDPDFDLTRPETFASIFPISKDKGFPQQVPPRIFPKNNIKIE